MRIDMEYEGWEGELSEDVPFYIPKESDSYPNDNNFDRELVMKEGYCSIYEYYWIKPVWASDYSFHAQMQTLITSFHRGISIEFRDFAYFFYSYFLPYYDPEMEANRKSRGEDGGYESENPPYYFTVDSVKLIIEELRETAEALSSGKELPLKVQKIMDWEIGHLKSFSDNGENQIDNYYQEMYEEFINMLIRFSSSIIEMLNSMVNECIERNCEFISVESPWQYQ